jgi:hypothetical protein
MKFIKTAATGLLAFALVSAASAQTVIRITGSTAFRNATELAIESSLNTGFTFGGVGSAAIGTNQMLFDGTLKSNSHAVIILTSFTGSEGGVYNLTHTTPPTNAVYINPSLAGSATTTGFTGYTSAQANDNTSADISLADTFQSSSLNKTPILNDTKVGIIPFAWVGAGTNDPAITNLTHQQIKAIFAGVATYGLWAPGDPAASDAVNVIGRDEDSGTRLNSLVESGFGTVSASPVQFAPEDSSSRIGTAAVRPYTATVLYPANTVNFVGYPAGHSGYSSGGTLQGVLNDVTITVDADIVSYLGLSDAKNGINATASSTVSPLTPLSWEGVNPWNFTTKTFNETVFENGTYTFWSYEHLFTRSSVTGDPAQLATDLGTILNTPASSGGIDVSASGYHIADLSVKRDTDGSPVYYP